jgi:hypothetical protein
MDENKIGQQCCTLSMVFLRSDLSQLLTKLSRFCVFDDAEISTHAIITPVHADSGVSCCFTHVTSEEKQKISDKRSKVPNDSGYGRSMLHALEKGTSGKETREIFKRATVLSPACMRG